jgi:protein-S-isoprenylcysteine O-methyltransferase Ste14
MTPMPGRVAILSFYGFLAAFAAAEWLATRFTFGARARGDRDPTTLFFLFFPAVGMFLWLQLVSGTPAIRPNWESWAWGVVAGAAGIAIRVSGKRTLGRFFTVRVQIQEGHRLVREGLYATIRHPLYTGLIVLWAAPPLLLGSPLGFLFLTVPIIVLVLRRIPREEALLLETFGEEYRAYMADTKRLIPGVW